MMYKSQFWKIDPYDWFCGPGSHITSCSSRLQNVINLPYKEQVWKWERDTDIKNEEKLIVWGPNQDNRAL